jgi:CubicO group peptidase (beta-lactamase class C family)
VYASRTIDAIQALVAGAGYRPGEPLLVAVRRGSDPPAVVVHGSLTASTRVYTASLSKQVTAAGAALLIQAGRLDSFSTLADWVPDLPSWAARIQLRHLVHHVAGLPSDVDIEGDRDRTTDAVIAALRDLSLDRPPGTAFAYSNPGYVCLALAIERAAGQPLPSFARQRLFDPLGLHDTLFWAGPGPMPPSSMPLARRHPAPLSLGDGGMWSTAADLLCWCRAMNADTLGVSALVQTPGRLDDGRSVDYAWGTGVRIQAGHPVYRHGGGWLGLRLLMARVPDLDVGLVIVAPADNTERRVPLADALLDLVIRP